MASKLRLVTGNRPVRTVSRPAEAGGWLSEPGMVRSRKALHILQHTVSKDASVSASFHRESARVLSPEELWKTYLSTPDVRACVDSITRRVATWDWAVEITVPAEDERYEAAKWAQAKVKRFLMSPVQDAVMSTWQEWADATTRDLMVFDAAVSEIVMNTGGSLAELVPQRGADFFPQIDEHGRVDHWRQLIYESFGIGGGSDILRPGQDGNAPRFEANELFFLRLFSNTSSPLGLPIIESLINEIVTLLVTSEHQMLAMNADEIPPGMLVLGGLGKEAAKRAREDLKHMRGKDHKIRVLTATHAKGVSADWIEFRRTLKDQGMGPIIDQVRRLVYRTFGVMPIEMGMTEGMPKATASVQMDVSSSHLITPILELLQAKVNSRLLPAILRPNIADEKQFQFTEEQLASIVDAIAFKFDLDERLSAEDQSFVAQKYQRYVDTGILSINEARAEIGRHPIDGGSVHTFEENGIRIPVTQLEIRGNEDLWEPTGFDVSGNDPDPVIDDAVEVEIVDDDEGTSAPGVDIDDEKTVAVAASRSAFERLNDLPSDWQPGGRFAGYRTLDLSVLGSEISGYSRSVSQLWLDAHTEARAILASEYKPNGLTDERVSRLLGRWSRVLEKFSVRWATATQPIYQRVGRSARDAVVDMSGVRVLETWEAQSDMYYQQAMGYLTATEGPVETLRTRMALIASILQTDGGISRTKDHRGKGWKPPADLGPGSLEEDAMNALDSVWDSQAHRVGNWSGRMVDLANGMLVKGLIESEATVPEEIAATEAPGTIWMAEWVAVGDKQTCDTCDYWGAQGILPIGQFPTQPGGQTECRARCRCVFVVWTASEVRNGTAEVLSGSAPGNEPL